MPKVPLSVILGVFFFFFFNYSGPAGVGVNELRRRLISSNPREFRSAVPRM